MLFSIFSLPDDYDRLDYIMRLAVGLKVKLHFANEEFVKFQEGYRHRLFKNNSLQHVPLNKTKPFFELETIKDKNIVIYDEQGIGYEISFIGLLDDFKKNISNNITIVCSERAKDIFNISL